MSYIPTPEKAYEILEKYDSDAFHRSHGLIVGGVMGYFAAKCGEDVGYWKAVGTLHDVDFGLYPDEHCVACMKIFQDEDIDVDFATSCASHGYGICEGAPQPTKHMEKILFACDELTGLIGAAARMRPSKSVSDMELSSLKKKFKDKKFAAGCSRDTIKLGAENLGMTIDELLNETLDAMKSLVGELGV